jgi:hypothetical protein
MSALGHKQTSCSIHFMSVIPLKADINQRGLYVRLVPQADSAAEHRSFRRRTRWGQKNYADIM